MRFSYNDVGGFINGVMFFFEKGDTKIAVATFEVINASEQKPTSIVWNGDSPTPSEVLRRLCERGALDSGFLGVRFTVDEYRLLKELLAFMRKSYPALLPMVKDIDGLLFSIPN